MLWKPAAPVYPKLIQEAPEGLTKSQADELRLKGKHLMPICKLGKYFISAVLCSVVSPIFLLGFFVVTCCCSFFLVFSYFSLSYGLNCMLIK